MRMRRAGDDGKRETGRNYWVEEGRGSRKTCHKLELELGLNLSLQPKTLFESSSVQSIP